MNLIKEEFNSIKDFLNTINNRPNNDIMRTKDSSCKSDGGFSGTKSYEEAVDLLENGYKDILKEIKSGTKLNIKPSGNQNRRIPRNAVVGYAPNVPNAILGIPQSMITVDRVKQKSKTLSIVYSNTGNCFVDTKEYIKCGIAILNLINTLELSGIRVNLKICPKLSKVDGGKECCYLTIKVKDYREQLNLQKICFPMAHPSMQRRFGFKWLETVPNLKRNGWNGGYGQSFTSHNDTVLKMVLNNSLKKDEIFINMPLINYLKYDVDKMIEYLKKNDKI